MTHDHLLCLDIETVPDTDVIPPDWPSETFPKAMWHRVVAISFVEARIERDDAGERYLVEGCRSGGREDWDERRLLKAFWRYFGQRQARVVTWNGRSFDMAVLRLRSMIYGVAAEPWFTRGNKWDNYGQRYAADWHCDLQEQMSDHGANPRLGLDDAARAIGLPGKIGGHGSEVGAMVAQGRIGEVRAYCEADTLNLVGLYVRWALLTGRATASGHDASMESLVRFLEAARGGSPHFGEFLDRWRSSTRPAPMLVDRKPDPAQVRAAPSRSLASLRRPSARQPQARWKGFPNHTAISPSRPSSN